MARNSKKAREYWIEIINQYKSSGLRQQQFCSCEGLGLGTFKTWLYRLRAEERQQVAAIASPLFALIVVESESSLPDIKAPRESALVLELSEKMRIVVQSEFGSETLRRLLNVVGPHV